MLGIKSLRRIDTLIRWDPSPHEWVKLNIDGAFWSTICHASFSGVLQDNQGAWLNGFSLQHQELFSNPCRTLEDSHRPISSLETRVLKCHPKGRLTSGYLSPY